MRAGTSHGTLYTHFRDKHDVFIAVSDELAASVQTAALAPARATSASSARTRALELRLRALLDAVIAERRLLRAWRQASALDADIEQHRLRFHESLATELTQRLERDHERGLLAPGIDLELASLALVEMTEAFVLDQSARLRAIDEHAAKQLTGIWLRSLYRTPPRSKTP